MSTKRNAPATIDEYIISDHSLPTWLHTLLCLGVTMPFGVPLLFFGGRAIVAWHLEPFGGPDGQLLFGASVRRLPWAVLALGVVTSFFVKAAP